MTLEYALKLLRKETSADEIEKLKYKNGFNREAVVNTIEEAICIVCDCAEEKIMDNNVDHPSHYNVPGKKECIVEMEDKFGADWVAIFCLMNAYKYEYRAGNKSLNPMEQDISKADWYKKYAMKLAQEGRLTDVDVFAETIRENL